MPEKHGQIHVTNVPPELVAVLRKQAEQSRRSFAQQVVYLLETAVSAEDKQAELTPAPVKRGKKAKGE